MRTETMDFVDFLFEEDLITVKQFIKFKGILPDFRWPVLCEELLNIGVNPKLQQNRYKAIVLNYDFGYKKREDIRIQDLYDPKEEEQ